MSAKRKVWQAQVKGLLRVGLKRRKLSYAGLTDKLAALGIKDNERNISNKIGRETFTVIFFFQCMEAIGCKTIHLEEYGQRPAYRRYIGRYVLDLIRLLTLTKLLILRRNLFSFMRKLNYTPTRIARA